MRSPGYSECSMGHGGDLGPSIVTSNRTVHDGFATIRVGCGGRGKRARSSPPGGNAHKNHHQTGGKVGHCTTVNCGPMSPLWEERSRTDGGVCEGAPVPRRERAQWWDIATRRSRYRSCPAFSQASVLTAVEQTMSSVTDRLEKLASSPDLKASEADELRKTAATLRKQSTAMSHSLGGLVSLERQMSCDSVSSVSSTMSATSGHPHHHHHHHHHAGCRGSSTSHGVCIHPLGLNANGHSSPNDPNKVKKRSWLRNSFRRAFGRKRSKHDAVNGGDSNTSPSIFLSRLRNNSSVSSQTRDLPMNHCRNSAVINLNNPQTVRTASGPKSHKAIISSNANPNLSINPNQLLSGYKGADSVGSTAPCSVSSSVRNSGVYSSPPDSGVLSSNGPDQPIFSAAQTATLLRRSLQGSVNESDLQQEVTEKQRLLTDCQLELLNTQHQLQNKTDHCDKLQVECAKLKEENHRLVEIIKQHLGSAADTVLAQSMSALNIGQQHSNSELSMGVSSSSKVCGRSLKVLVVESYKGLLSTTHAQDNLGSATTVHVGHLTVAPKTSWPQLDSLVYAVVKDFNSQIDPRVDSNSSSSPNHLYSTLSFPPRHHQDLPDSCSESSKTSSSSLRSTAATPWSSLLLCYQLAEVVRAPSEGTPELMPYGYAVGNVEEIRVWLRGGQQTRRTKDQNEINEREAASVSFASNIPADVITSLTKTLVTSRRLLICGPPNSGKSSLASAVAQHYVACTGVTHGTVRHFTATRTNSLDLCQLLTSATRTNSTVPQSLPAVLVLDDIHAVSGVTDTVQRCLQGNTTTNVPIIAIGSKPASFFSTLTRQCQFNCEELSPSSEPLRGFVGRALRRRLLCAEAAIHAPVPEARLIVDWLERLWCRLNESNNRDPNNKLRESFSRLADPSQTFVSPTFFLDYPVQNLRESQRWFRNIWNDRIIPVLRASRRAKVSFFSGSPMAGRYSDSNGATEKSASAFNSLKDECDENDPTVWVLNTYPWPPSADYGPQNLQRISPDSAEIEPSSIYTSSKVSTVGRTAEGVYAIPSTGSTGAPRTIPLSSLKSYSTNNNSESVYGYKSKQIDSEGENSYNNYRTSYGSGKLSHNQENGSLLNGDNNDRKEDRRMPGKDQNGHHEGDVSEVPSGMALLVPYKSQSSFNGTAVLTSNGLHTNTSNNNGLYKPLKSFANYNTTNGNKYPTSNCLYSTVNKLNSYNVSRSSISNTTSKTSVEPETKNPENGLLRVPSLTDPILEEGEDEENINCHKPLIMNGNIEREVDKRMSRSSEEMMDVEGSNSSGASTSSDPIYSTIRKEKAESSTGSEEEIDPIYFTVPQDRPPTSDCLTNGKTCGYNANKKGVLHRGDGVTDTVTIICNGKKRRGEIKDLSHELTTTFKPVETSM